jgi:hypothetical protein
MHFQRWGDPVAFVEGGQPAAAALFCREGGIMLSHHVGDRVQRMINDARTQFGCTMSINQSTRTAEQAQQFHVCHMFLHNFFRHLKPKHVAADGRTIDWLHLSDPAVTWALIPRPELSFLLTKSNQPAQKRVLNGRASWVPGYEPDKQASARAMARFLERSHVKSMAAPGLTPCGEPCGCGGHASKHITGDACDVSGLDQLGQLLLGKQLGFQTADEAVDHFLAGYHLWRPLAHLPGKAREAWHLEALPVKHAHTLPAGKPGLKLDASLHMKLNSDRSLQRFSC